MRKERGVESRKGVIYLNSHYLYDFWSETTNPVDNISPETYLTLTDLFIEDIDLHGIVCDKQKANQRKLFIPVYPISWDTIGQKEMKYEEKYNCADQDEFDFHCEGNTNFKVFPLILELHYFTYE